MPIPLLARIQSLCHNRILVWAISTGSIALFLLLRILFPDISPTPDFAPAISPSLVLIVFLLAHFCEYIDSTLGMGYGTTLTPVLLLFGFSPLQVVPCILLSEMLTGLAATLLHHHDGNVDLLRDRKVRFSALLLCSLSIMGTVMAVTLSVKLPKLWINSIIAIILLSVGMVILTTMRKKFRFRPAQLILVGAVAAFNKGLSGGGYGPLTTSGQVISGFSPKQAVAITFLAESFTCFVGLIAYIVLSKHLDFSLALPLTIGALLSVPISTWTVRKLPEKNMRGAVGISTVVLGTALLMKNLL